MDFIYLWDTYLFLLDIKSGISLSSYSFVLLLVFFQSPAVGSAPAFIVCCEPHFPPREGMKVR
jgi:hypothetical protein